MLPSRITTQHVSLWSMIGLFAVTLFLLPTAFTVAQDYDAVIERLKQAVDAKEISPEQAKKMIATLKNSSSKKASAAKPAVKKSTSHAKLDWEAAKNKIEGAVKAGKLTRQQADAHYLALKNQSAQKPAVKKDVSNAKVDWGAIKNRIESGVKAGKLTREQADARYAALKEQTAQKPAAKNDTTRDPKIAFEKAAKEVRAAIEAGKITAEQGRARLAAYRKYLAEGQEKEAPKATDHAPQEQRRIREVKIRNVNGVKNIYVTENDRKITIMDDPDRGITIEITDAQDGKPITRAFRAKNVDELQEKSPEAHKLYKKYSQDAPGTR